MYFFLGLFALALLKVSIQLRDAAQQEQANEAFWLAHNKRMREVYSRYSRELGHN